MTTQFNPRLLSPLQFFSQAASAFVILVGFLVLVGWMLDIVTLKSVFPGLVTMKANTALAFLLAGMSLWLLQRKRPEPLACHTAQGCALIVALVGLLTLSEYLFGWNLGIDQLLFTEPLGAVGTFAPGRMAPNTAFNFLVVGVALLLLRDDTRRGYRPAQILTITAAMISLFALIGYAYGVPPLYGLASYTQMALHTVVAFMVLCLGILFARPDHGLMALVTRDSAGGVLARRLLFPAVGIPAVLGWLRLEAQRAGLFDAEFGVALLVLLSIIAFTILIFATSRSLDRADTKRKKAEEALRRTLDELEVRVEKRTADLARANEELQAEIAERKQTEEELQRQRETLMQSEKLAAMGELLAGVAHELNNPLAVVVGQTDLLRQAAGEGALAERAGKIAQAAERCARIVRNFLALARRHPPQRQRVDLNRVVREAAELLAYQLQVDNVKVSLDLAPDLPILWADLHQFQQVVVNLITNAHQAMRGHLQPRRLTLTTQFDPARARVRLDIADTGPGIPPEVRLRIFEPFFTTKPPGQGTGLGLSLCHGIVEGHGGSIWVESEPGQGTVFQIQLPLEAPPVAVPEARVTEDLPPVRGKAILLVDDEPEVAGVLADLLSLDGHHVETAPNGALALEKLKERAYDLILSDIKMPEMDGLTFYQELKRCRPELLRRFIFVTGDALGPETAEFLEQTGAPSLGKPLVLEEVQRVVQQVLQAAALPS